MLLPGVLGSWCVPSSHRALQQAGRSTVSVQQLLAVNHIPVILQICITCLLNLLSCGPIRTGLIVPIRTHILWLWSCG